jgi:hypothetical protein
MTAADVDPYGKLLGQAERIADAAQAFSNAARSDTTNRERARLLNALEGLCQTTRSVLQEYADTQNRKAEA